MPVPDERGFDIREVRVRPDTSGATADLAMVSLDAVDQVGAAPKTVTYSQLGIARDAGGRWRCAVTIDV